MAAAVAAVTRRARTGHGSVSRVSLARVTHWLTSGAAQRIPFRFDRPGDPFGSSVARWIG
jgi:hypothetical protein